MYLTTGKKTVRPTWDEIIRICGIDFHLTQAGFINAGEYEGFTPEDVEHEINILEGKEE